MLVITVPGGEFWDEKTERFLHTKPVKLKLEHSLISISKWESKWCIPFIDTAKTDEQTYDYIKCMTLNQDIDDDVYLRLSLDNIKAINEYINAPMTATTIRSGNSRRSREIVTSELIYYYMIVYGIPEAFEKWHINRLIMLIRVCAEKNNPKKMSSSDTARYYAELNKQRKAKLGTKG